MTAGGSFAIQLALVSPSADGLCVDAGGFDHLADLVIGEPITALVVVAHLVSPFVSLWLSWLRVPFSYPDNSLCV